MAAPAEIGRMRQALVTGRIAERLTLRPLRPQTLTLELVRAAGARALPVVAGFRAGGWYALTLPSGAALPAVPMAEAAELRLMVTLADGRVQTAARAVSGADLASLARPVLLEGARFAAETVAGAPFALDCLFDPSPVMLAGVVIANHDPALPVPGATVSAGAESAATDDRGRFRLSLPVAAEVAVRVTHAAATADFTHRPDFLTPLNLTELSIPL